MKSLKWVAITIATLVAIGWPSATSKYKQISENFAYKGSILKEFVYLKALKKVGTATITGRRHDMYISPEDFVTVIPIDCGRFCK